MRILIVANAVLIGAIAGEMLLFGTSTRDAPKPVQEIAPSTESTPTPGPRRPTRKALASLERKPIFFEDREAPAPTEVAAAPETEGEEVAIPAEPPDAEPLEARLVGTMVDGDFRLAVVETGGAAQRLYPGDVVDGWRLTSVASHAVVFVNGEAQTELALTRGAGAGEGSARAAPARAVEAARRRAQQRKAREAARARRQAAEAAPG